MKYPGIASLSVLTALGLIMLWMVSACGGSDGGDAAPVANATHPGWIPYANHCAICHGQHGRGRSASNLVDGRWEYGSSREEIHRNIAQGIREAAMPDFGRSLSAEQIDMIIDALHGEQWDWGGDTPGE
ncbi:MAG: c-type cytochrome [Candidatus Sumerlaeia bacterium]|nr:c-type cytochrome [Candidatus Sumerlaeia bacterium]